MAGRLSTKTGWYLAAGGYAALVSLLADNMTVTVVSAAFGALLVVIAAVSAWRGTRIGPWIMAGLVGLSVATTASVLLWTLGGSGALLASDIMALATAALMITGLTVIARLRRGVDSWAVVTDGGIVALGSWLLAWVVLVQPLLERPDSSSSRAIVQSTFEPLGTIVVFLMVIVLFSSTSHTLAMKLLAFAVAFALGGGLLRALHDSGRIAESTLLSTVLSIAAMACLAGAIAHPSAASLVQRQMGSTSRATIARNIITTAALIVPIVVMSSTASAAGYDRVIRTVSVGLLAVLATLRIMQAVRSNRNAQETLLHTARTDSLTGLPNRGYLLDEINATLHESWKGAAHPTLFFIDIDRFKNINDSLGHAAGDRVLCTIAERLRRAAPERATVARISGDEYVVLDPASPGLEDALALANTLLASFREPLPLAMGDVFVSASIGVARSDPQSHRSADVLLRHADTAMYQAKDAGRNCVALFDESMHERVAHRLTVETALFRALDRRELRLYYQPILDLGTADVIGFEALMRWQQGDGTIVSPAEFIPIAEETGTIIPIGAWALQEAMSQLRRWVDDGVCSPVANMSVNVSPRQLADPSFPTIVNDALQMSGVSAHQLWLEVTEGIMITEPEIALATLKRLRSLGVRVAIDDFGTGYSSLSLLQKFPLQRIKIDRAFVQGVADNNNDRSLVRTIIAMGASLGLDMVAEGVETVQQMQVLSELGCSKAQGYLISHPVPPDAMRSTVTALERMGAWPGVRQSRSPFASFDDELESELTA